MRQAIAICVLGCLGLAAGGCANGGGTGAANGKAVRLEGAGSSFVNLIMQKWSRVYNADKGVEVNYQSVGSTGGIQKMLDKTVDFACSDAPLKDEDLTRAKEIGGGAVHIPLVMGGAVAAYNLKGLDKPVKFTGPVLADIFMGKITKWNDPALKEINQDLNLPDTAIAVVHRSDGSGTTDIWTDYLCKVSPEWKSKVGRGTAVNWPCGVGQKGSEGISGHVARTEGAIGYVELIYALKNKIPFGSVKNKEGEFVLPTLESVTAAANASLDKIPDDLRYSITEAPGRESYPISGTTWAIVFVNQPSDRAGMVDFLRWVTHEGQKYCGELQYATLPTKLVERVDAKLAQIHAGK